MNLLRNFTLRGKLTLIVVSTTVLSMLAAAAVIIHFEEQAIRSGMVSELETTADLLGANAAVALRFDSPEDGEAILRSLRAKPQINGGCFLRPDGSLFAHFSQAEPWLHEPPELVAGHAFTDTDLTLLKAIEHDGDLIGYVHVQSDLSILEAKRRQAIVTTLVSILAFSTIAVMACLYLLGIVGRPIDSLVQTANKVSETQDYALRAQRYSDDELGVLTNRFNNMLDRIQQRETKLREIQEELESRVKELAAEKQEVELAHGRESELQDQLARSQRLESLGILAGGVAHDLNNILGPLVAYPDLIVERLPPEEKDIRRMLIRMRESARKAAGVIRNLLTLGRRGNINLEPMSLNLLLGDYFESFDFQELQERFPRVKLRQDMAPELGAINASPHHLTQVIMNLVINAYEAIEGEGELLVQTRVVEIDETLKGYQTVEPGRYVLLRVQDNGHGIAADKLQRIFEPFYTEKQMGASGSGLGLAVVYGVVQDLHGRIDVHGNNGKGACFDLYFPSLEADLKHTPIVRPTATDEQRILVVDDAAEQREVVTVVLESLGYSVTAAEHGHHALEIMEKQHFDLVVLDMIMEEGFDGLDTYRAISHRHPGQKCIIASGYAESDRVKEALRAGVGGYVAKPYTLNSIGSAIREELARDSSEHA
ncbi:MAG: hypothetical protein SynsKO_27330 [Synoicihabitans sp.]